MPRAEGTSSRVSSRPGLAFRSSTVKTHKGNSKFEQGGDSYALMICSFYMVLPDIQGVGPQEATPTRCRSLRPPTPPTSSWLHPQELHTWWAPFPLIKKRVFHLQYLCAVPITNTREFCSCSAAENGYAGNFRLDKFSLCWESNFLSLSFVGRFCFWKLFTISCYPFAASDCSIIWLLHPSAFHLQ